MSVAGAFCAPATASAAPGDLDPSFGSGGEVRLHDEVTMRAVAVQPDLKIVLAGVTGPGNVILVRLLPDGALDPGFGVGGHVITPFAGGSGEARAIALQPDGRIVVAGTAGGGEDNDFLVARYNADGWLDPGFGGGDGVQLVPFGPLYDSAEAVAIGPRGHILVTGRTDLEGGKKGAAVVVLRPEGNAEAAFSEDGKTILDTTEIDSDEGVAITELADGRILLGDSTGDGFTLARLLASGLPDSEFGEGDGIVKTTIPGTPVAKGRLADFVLRPDGRIVASGYGYDLFGSSVPGVSPKYAAAGYLADGELDPSFGNAGTFTKRIAPGSHREGAQVIERTPAGKFLLAGNYDNFALSSGASTALMRLDPFGFLDPGFGNGGLALREAPASSQTIFEDAALDAEERMVVVSSSSLAPVVVSRFLGDKVPPQPGVGVNQPAHARMKPVPRKVVAEKLKGFSGTASDRDGNGLKRVQVALVRRGTGVKASRAGLRWRQVRGKRKWSLRLKGELRPGRYVVYARAVDGLGLAEAKFSRKLRNRYGFRVLP